MFSQSSQLTIKETDFNRQNSCCQTITARNRGRWLTFPQALSVCTKVAVMTDINSGSCESHNHR